ncbi:MAG: alpha/beta hydrolase [Verrucomicrobiota bacterium]
MMISWRSHLIAFLLAGLFAQDCVSEEALPENAVPYGEDPAQRFELWVPEEATLQSRAPVLIYFPSSQLIFKEPHRFDPDPFLKSGIAVVVASYRKVKVSQITSPIPLNDGVRILEKLQAESETQPIDPGRIGVIGHEAGGIVALWLAYQRNPEKPSPPVSVAVAIDTPTRLDPSWMAKEIGGRLTVSAGTRLLFRLSIAEAGKEPIKSRLESISPWHLAD